MKVMISYFNNIRNFDTDVLPVSTAMWDPKWYHNSLAPDNIFIDKRGIVNGMKCRKLILPITDWYELENSNEECRHDCPFIGTNCKFMQKYRHHLDTIKFDKLLTSFQTMLQYVNQLLGLECKDVVLLVHEKPDKLCSERVVLKAWFKDHGLELEEYKYDSSKN